MTLPNPDDDRVDDLTVSALFVLYVLADGNEPLTTVEIADRTQLNERTVRLAVERLREADLAESKPSLNDARKTIHVVADL